jgi:hypothetical protein
VGGLHRSRRVCSRRRLLQRDGALSRQRRGLSDDVEEHWPRGRQKSGLPHRQTRRRLRTSQRASGSSRCTTRRVSGEWRFSAAEADAEHTFKEPVPTADIVAPATALQVQRRPSSLLLLLKQCRKWDGTGHSGAHGPWMEGMKLQTRKEGIEVQVE